MQPPSRADVLMMNVYARSRSDTIEWTSVKGDDTRAC